MSRTNDYAVLIEPLPESEGGGYLAIVPDLPGCMSDGDTVHDAIDNLRDAMISWKQEAAALGREIPKAGKSAGQWRQRVPRSLHETLKRMARAEGVSLNAYVTTVLAESVGRKIGE